MLAAGTGSAVGSTGFFQARPRSHPEDGAAEASFIPPQQLQVLATCWHGGHSFLVQVGHGWEKNVSGEE